MTILTLWLAIKDPNLQVDSEEWSDQDAQADLSLCWLLLGLINIIFYMQLVCLLIYKMFHDLWHYVMKLYFGLYISLSFNLRILCWIFGVDLFYLDCLK